jgi:CubicO group peptidase (beta-lactamase class C family)
MEREGRWGHATVVRPDWIAAMTTASNANPEYGLLWWLNTDRKAIPAAPAAAFWAAGFGGNYVYVDREHDLVVVLRWVPEYRDVIGAFVQAIAR